MVDYKICGFCINTMLETLLPFLLLQCEFLEGRHPLTVVTMVLTYSRYSINIDYKIQFSTMTYIYQDQIAESGVSQPFNQLGLLSLYFSL